MNHNFSVLFLLSYIYKIIDIIHTHTSFQNKTLELSVLFVINDTLYHNLNMPYVRDKIRELNQRYTDRLEEYPNIFMRLIS
jgi:hypothetical protein